MKHTDDTTHRWVVDGLEEGMARVEEDGGRVLTVPAWLLPPDVREGQVLAVSVARGPGTAAVTIAFDAAATADALARSRETVDAASVASRKRDPGGDVVL